MSLQGDIKGSEDGWKFYGQFGYPDGPVLYKIEGRLSQPVKDLSAPHAVLVNPRDGPSRFTAEIGPQLLNLRSLTSPMRIMGKLADTIAPVRVEGTLIVVEVNPE